MTHGVEKANNNGIIAAESEASGEAHPVLWEPNGETIAATQMHRFQQWLDQQKGVKTGSYEELQNWSVDHLETFWGAIWEYFDVTASNQPEAVLEDNSMPGARWFTGATLNYAEHLLRHARTMPDETALIGTHEQAPNTHLTWSELESRVAGLAARLRQLGVRPGDRVAAVLPNIPETVIALLATAAVGAVWSVVSTDFGITGIADRFSQIEPRVIFTVDGYEFNGTIRDRASTIISLREALPTVATVILVDQLSSSSRESAGIKLPIDVERFSEILDNTAGARPDYHQVAFDHPLWILYSSGTTGKPKGIVHGHGGIITEALKANHLHYDLDHTSRSYFAVSTTWVVWNLLVDTMMAGSSIITYDGSPTHGSPDKHFEIVAKYGATFFGTGAAVLTMIERSRAVPRSHYDLRKLKSIFVTGSPLPDPGWDWLYQAVSPTIRVCSDSGGTDVATAFIGSNPIQSVRRGLLMGSYLGVAAESWNQFGDRVHNQVGEFVITKPMPSMPIYFWNDADDRKYRESYFETYPGVWRHGDWVTEFSDGSFVVHGRSDSTINRGGIRMGSADITHIVDEVSGVEASMVIGAELNAGDYYMPLFVVPSPGFHVTDTMAKAINSAIRTDISPRYIPDEIIEVTSLPRTKTGKLMEIPIKRLIQGKSASAFNRSVAEDENVIDWYIDFADDFRNRHHSEAKDK